MIGVEVFGLKLTPPILMESLTKKFKRKRAVYPMLIFGTTKLRMI